MAAPQATQTDTKMAMLEFRVEHPDYQQGSALDMEMGKVVAENPLFWADHLDQAYKIAKANMSGSDVESRIEKARSEEREKLARKSTLSQPSSQATAQTQADVIRTPQMAESFMNNKKITTEEYNRRLPELESVLGVELRPRK